jgi:hypothetical protein
MRLSQAKANQLLGGIMRQIAWRQSIAIYLGMEPPLCWRHRHCLAWPPQNVDLELRLYSQV